MRFKHVDIRSNQSHTKRYTPSRLKSWSGGRQLRWASLEALPRKRFPGALFSRTSHRRPLQRTIFSIYRLTLLPYHRSCHIPKTPFSILTTLVTVIVIVIIPDVTIYVRACYTVMSLLRSRDHLSRESPGFLRKKNIPVGCTRKVSRNRDSRILRGCTKQEQRNILFNKARNFQ